MASACNLSGIYLNVTPRRPVSVLNDPRNEFAYTFLNFFS